MSNVQTQTDSLNKQNEVQKTSLRGEASQEHMQTDSKNAVPLEIQIAACPGCDGTNNCPFHD